MSSEEKVANIACAVLTGGKNTRMSGRNKAYLLIDGIPIIQRTIDLLKGIFKDIILVTNSPDDYRQYEGGCLIVTDIIRDVGPLGGIHAALSGVSQDAVFFVACDMPFLHNGIIRRQIEYFQRVRCDAVIPKIGDSIEPLHGIYSTALIDKIERYVNESSDYPVRGFLDTIDTAYFELPDEEDSRRVFSNINTAQDWERIKQNESKVKGMA